MANRIHHAHQGSMTPGLVSLTGRVKLGTNGAITDQSGCRGFSVARVSPGLYTITLDDVYVDIHDATATIVTAGAVPAAGKAVGYCLPKSTNTVPAGGKTFQMQMLQTNSTAGDIDDNGEVWFEFTMVNSNQKY